MKISNEQILVETTRQGYHHMVRAAADAWEKDVQHAYSCRSDAAYQATIEIADVWARFAGTKIVGR